MKETKTITYLNNNKKERSTNRFVLVLVCIGFCLLLCFYLLSIILQIEDRELLLLPNVPTSTQPTEMTAITAPAPLTTTTDGINSNPRICRDAKTPLTWVMFMGDSNMRHTYYWWTTQKKKSSNTVMQKGSTYGLDRSDLDYGGRWADQELLVGVKNSTTGEGGVVNDSIARYSFRFLHGSVNEFINSAKKNNWDIARQAAPSPEPEDVKKEVDKLHLGGQKKGESKSNDDMLWEGKIRPSDFAIWATKHQTPIDDNSFDFNSNMSKWKKKISPDVVILTQGWGGVPRGGEVETVRTIVRNNPETLFIWSPMYVTDRMPDRYDSYVESGVFSWTEPNLRVVDLWDMVTGLPKQKIGGSLLHIPVGGSYMKKAMERIWREVDDACTNSTNQQP